MLMVELTVGAPWQSASQTWPELMGHLTLLSLRFLIWRMGITFVCNLSIMERIK
jgi:hypothetical protein